MTSSVTGLDSTLARLHRIYVLAETSVGPALTAIGLDVAEDMSAHVKRDTGKLAENIDVGPVEKEWPLIWVKVGPNKKGWYGKFLEWGTRFMPAYPFVRPARDRKKKEVAPRLRDIVGQAIKRG